METKIFETAEHIVIEIAGRVDTLTAEELEKTLLPLFEKECPKMVLDCERLEYVSSSGLRLFLMAHKRMTAKGGRLILTHIHSEVRSVLDLTGFSNILEIEN